jgi:hypothetical protein
MITKYFSETDETSSDVEVEIPRAALDLASAVDQYFIDAWPGSVTWISDD